MIRIGPAGWSYPDWQGIAYPARKPRGFHPLSYLARFVPCVELNSSFYGLPSARNAERWVELVADRPEFRFLAKVHQDFTHGPLPAAGEHDPWPTAARAFLAGLAPLVRERRLAALLLQFPVSFQRNEEAERRVERLTELFQGQPDCALAIEVRHKSWFEPAPLARFAALKLAVAHIDLPAAREHPPGWHEPTAPLGYLRLHGRNTEAWFRPAAGRDQRYDHLYGPAELNELAAKARRLAGVTDETYVVTNNHFEGKALANALDLRALLEEGPVAAPAELVARYPYLADHTHAEGQLGLFGV